MLTLNEPPKPRPTISRYNMVVRGWLGIAGRPVLGVRTINLSTAGAQVRMIDYPPSPNTRMCLRLSLLAGDKVKLADIDVVVRDSVLSKQSYRTQLDFVNLSFANKELIEQVVRGRTSSTNP